MVGARRALRKTGIQAATKRAFRLPRLHHHDHHHQYLRPNPHPRLSSSCQGPGGWRRFAAVKTNGA